MSESCRFEKTIQKYFNGIVPTYKEIEEMLLSITEPRIQLFSILTYLWAARIEEMCRYKQPLHVKVRIKNVDNNKLRLDGLFKGGATVFNKYFDKYGTEILILKIVNPKYGGVFGFGVKKVNINIEVRRGVDFLTCRFRNLKNRNVSVKNNVAKVVDESRIVGRALELLEGYGLEDELFPYTRQWIHRLFKLYAPFFVYPHFLRGCRLTHLVVRYNFNEQRLIKFAGWSDGRPARYYMSFSVLDMMDAMMV